MRTSGQRIAKYGKRMLSSLIDPVLAAVNTLAVENFAAYVTEFYPLQETLRGKLDSYGIPTVEYAAYEAFNGEIYHLSKVSSGSSAVVVATALVAKYVAWGLDEDNLVEICGSMYTITVIPVGT